MRQRLLWLASVGLAAFILAACGSGDDPSPTAVPTVSTPEPTPVPVSFGQVVWASAIDEETGAPVDSLTTLPNTASQVYASVQAEVLPAGVPVQARWSIDGSELPDLDPSPVTVDEDRAEAWISWSLTWTVDEPWPAGVLGIEIEVNGETGAASEILIVRDQAADGG
ncbi:MAG: hypothetical protein M3451_05970 [Chloroflexota bacterium]|jgi:hypothetical protein|nr:hypothetical protein [Chloroflexota bacterium]